MLYFFWIIGGFSTNFSALWDQNKRQNRDTPIIQKILNSEHFWNTDGFAHDDLWRCETKKFDKIVIPLLSKIFWYQNISERQNGSPTMFFGDLGQKDFHGKTWHPLLILFFRTRKFLKHKSVPHEVFRYRETKPFRRKVAEFLFYAKSFWMTQFSWIFEGFPTKNSAPWDKKVQKSCDSLLCKIFSIPKDFWSTRVLLRIFLVLWDKNDQQNCDTPII